MLPEGLFSIENFTTEAGRSRGGYDLAIILAKPVVKALLNAPERREENSPLLRDLLQRIKLSVPPADRGFARLDFHGDTWLLLGMHGGGDCACCGVAGGSRTFLERGEERTLRYTSHNIDTPEQAAAVVSTWLMWFNNAVTLTGFKLPTTY